MVIKKQKTSLHFQDSFTKEATRHGNISHPLLPAAVAYDVLGCPKDWAV